MGWDVIVGVAFGTVLTGVSAWALNKVYENLQSNIRTSKEITALRANYIDLNSKVSTLLTNYHDLKHSYDDLHTLYKQSLEDLTRLRKYTYHLSQNHKETLSVIQDTQERIKELSNVNERHGKVIRILHDDLIKRYKKS
jgi:predicted  nucleic acid-binding Zn-ribbon protein